MVKRKGFRAYKRLTTLHMTNGCKQGRVERSAFLAKRFSERCLRRLVFQDQKDFLHQIPKNFQTNRVYFSLSKNDFNLNL